MPHPPTQFKLKIQDVEQTVLFELSWNDGLPMDARVTIPSHLLEQYQTWRDRYYDFYRTAQISLSKETSSTPTDVTPDSAIRGRKAGGAKLTIQPKDSRKKLVKAELDLTYSFNLWLRSPELYEIRDRLAQASRDVSSSSNNGVIDLFLTFTSSKLLRLPWEAWEIGSESAPIANIRIARTPANIHQSLSAAALSSSQSSDHQSASRQRSPHRQYPRILVILGDDTGLELTADLASIQTLRRTTKAYIRPVGWKAGQSIDELSNELMDAIADPRGWDILFFAGHSHEMKLGGGGLAIAPKTTIALKELKPSLVAAQRHGLKFALFNSCSGLDIAAQLIDWGLSQVAVMREPIHNQVAQTFLEQFLQGLADHKDVHETLLDATDFFKSKTNIAYPSAHLIPTLFRHPQSTLYQIKKRDWKERLQRLLPTRYEAIALGVLAAVSLVPPVQNTLLDRRIGVQAQHRHMTGRVEANPSPPVVLVRIDNDSLEKANLTSPEPMSKPYLASVIQGVAQYQPKLVGMDYVLDRPSEEEEETAVLKSAITEAMAQGTQFVFAAVFEHQNWQTITPELLPDQAEYPDAPPKVDGDINLWIFHMSLPNWFRDEYRPFAYELARLHCDNQFVQTRTQRSLLTLFSYNLGQRWAEPIVDYSIPPKQIYEEVSAWTLLDPATRPRLDNLDQQVLLIVPNYSDAGIPRGSDNEPAPRAVQYWSILDQPNQKPQETITGGERHAYQLHHFLTRRLVIPLPDIAFVLMAAVLGKSVVLLWTQRRAVDDAFSTHSPVSRLQGRTVEWKHKLNPWAGWGIAGTIFYGVFSLEVYVSPLAIMMPILLPTLMFWLYVAPILWNPHRR